jgi:hypothetical protein
MDLDRTFLDKRDTSFISEYNNDGTTGLPKYYANWDDNNIVVAPTPDSICNSIKLHCNPTCFKHYKSNRFI